MTFNDAIARHKKVVDALEALVLDVDRVALSIKDRIENGGRVYWLGNGGSAADAQHYAAELMVRYTKNRKPIPSIALTTDTSLLTAHTNDFSFDTVFSRQVEALVTASDVVVGISTSGNSENVRLAIKKASELGALTVGLLGNDGGLIKPLCEQPLVVDCEITAHIQEAHLMIGHYICDFVESNLCEL